MLIREMSREECVGVLARARLARLACVHENQPYVVPVYLAYHDASGYLYGFTTLGQKVEWMRANPLVCVEVDEIAAYDRWVSIVVSGSYEELPKTSGDDTEPGRPPERSELQVGEVMSTDSHYRDVERKRAWQLLESHPMWQEPGSSAWVARAHRDPAKPFALIFYRIRIDRVTGHEATRES